MIAWMTRSTPQNDGCETNCASFRPGTYQGKYYVDDDGVTDERIKIVTSVTIEDGSIAIDFTGTDRQRRSPINATISSCESAAYFAILSVIDSSIPANYGVYKPINIIAPEGTVVNAQPPAAVVGRNAITHTIVNALMMALSQVVPERVTAGYYGMSNVHILSGDGTGDRPNWILFDIEVGGGGGRQSKDGLDCYSQGIHNLANTPIEMIELTYPLRFSRYEFIPDTGGAGRHRGGLGVRRDIEFLDESGMLETQFDKFKVEPFGIFGGAPGATGKMFFNPDGPARSPSLEDRRLPVEARATSSACGPRAEAAMVRHPNGMRSSSRATSAKERSPPQRAPQLWRKGGIMWRDLARIRTTSRVGASEQQRGLEAGI